MLMLRLILNEENTMTDAPTCVPTSLAANIRRDQMVARKNRATLDINLLTTLVSDIGTFEKNVAREITDSEVMDILQKFVKNTKITLASVPTHEVALHELKLLEGYLPKQLNIEELTKIISDFIAEHGKDIGKIMGHLKANHAGLFDGKVASEVIKSL